MIKIQMNKNPLLTYLSQLPSLINLFLRFLRKNRQALHNHNQWKLSKYWSSWKKQKQPLRQFKTYIIWTELCMSGQIHVNTYYKNSTGPVYKEQKDRQKPPIKGPSSSLPTFLMSVSESYYRFVIYSWKLTLKYLYHWVFISTEALKSQGWNLSFLLVLSI